MKNKIKTILLFGSFVLPSLSYAAVLGGTTAFAEQADELITTYLIPIAFSLALLFFFWGVALYIRSAGSEKEEGRNIMVWGVVALFVMSSIWGLVNFIRGEVGLKGDDTTMKIPKITP